LRIGIFDERNGVCEIRVAAQDTHGIEWLKRGPVRVGGVWQQKSVPQRHILPEMEIIQAHSFVEVPQSYFPETTIAVRAPRRFLESWLGFPMVKSAP
jgi:hypothetical protein